jgi:hypothetical protein
MEYSIDHIDIDAPGMGDDYIALAAVELRKRHPNAVVVSGRPVAAGDILGQHDELREVRPEQLLIEGSLFFYFLVSRYTSCY